MAGIQTPSDASDSLCHMLAPLRCLQEGNREGEENKGTPTQGSHVSLETLILLTLTTPENPDRLLLLRCVIPCTF